MGSQGKRALPSWPCGYTSSSEASKGVVKLLGNLMMLAGANGRKREEPGEMLKCSQICRKQINGFEDRLVWKPQI